MQGRVVYGEDRKTIHILVDGQTVLSYPNSETLIETHIKAKLMTIKSDPERAALRRLFATK
jgi:hypothetical protein